MLVSSSRLQIGEIEKFLADEEDDAGDIIQVREFIEGFFLHNVEIPHAKARDKDTQYGDILRHSFLQYRNDGVYIYDGCHFVPLSSEPDDYGCVPKTFPAITQFPILYFSQSIDHNRNV